MPVTAKLSRKFYEKLGDDITNELVNWFNQVDATYQADLRELNELNFARFDARLEQRAAVLEAKLEQRAAAIEAKLEREVGELKAALATLESRLETRLAGFEARITRWMFVFWVGTLGTLIALRHL